METLTGGRLLTISEFYRAEVGMRSEQRVYQLIQDGLLPVVRLGRRVFIDPVAWEKFKAAGGKRLKTKRRKSGR